MPIMTLSFVIMAQMVRMSRAALVTQLEILYVEMAILKGARPARIVLSHALPNALGPIVNAVALSLPAPRRRHHRRDHLQLSRPGEADGRRRLDARHAARPGLCHDPLAPGI